MQQSPHLSRQSATLAIVCCALLPGCNAWLASNETGGISDQLSKSSQEIHSAKDEPAVDRAEDVDVSTDAPFAELATGEWVLAPVITGEVDRLLNPYAEPVWPARRWRHAGLETMLSRADAKRQLLMAARDRDPIVATNAAIGLAQLDDPSGMPLLVATVLANKGSRPLRGAAVESLANLTTRDADASLVRLADEVGRWEGAARARYIPELHADVVRGISLRPRSKSGDAIAAAIASPSADVRYEAARGYERLCGAVELPADFADLMGDESAKVRAAALSALAVHRSKDAHAAVERGLADADLAVRVAAVQSFAELGGSKNQDRLRLILDDSVDPVRAAAVQGLVRLDDVASAAQAVSDKSWRVRLALAASLAQLPPHLGATIAGQLMGDADLKVQRRAIESLTAWPIADAIPLLLAAAERGSVLARRDAIDQLQRRWPAAANFPRQASTDRQLAEIMRLKAVWQEQSADSAARGMPERVEWNAEDEAQAISAVAALNAPLLLDRRIAARKLATEYNDKSLPTVELEKLCDFVEKDTDGPIWIDVMAVIARSDAAAAGRIAGAAASHPNSEVRRRACAWFGAHPSETGGRVLINSLEDEDSSVVLAAVQSLGAQPQFADGVPLVGLLGADDHTLRVAVAESLARQNVPAGMDALSRLTYDHEAKVRRLAATAIGKVYSAASDGAASFLESHRDRLVADLVRLLNDRAEIRRAAVIALGKVTGEAPPKSAAPAPSRGSGTLPDELQDTAAAAAWWKQRFAAAADDVKGQRRR